MRNIRLRMKSMILLVLIPALLLVTLTMGGLIYSGLHSIIINGFDRKLQAISSVTGSFIDGEEHSRILLERDIVGLSLDSKRGILYGIDSATGYLVSIQRDTGGAVDIGPLGFVGIRDLAFDPVGNVLYGVSATTLQLVRINPRTGAGKAVGQVSEAFSGLAFDPQTRTLWASNKNLWRLDPKTGRSQKLGLIGFEDVLALTLNSSTRILYGSDRKTGNLVTINLGNGQGKAIRRIRPLRPESKDTEMPTTLVPNKTLEWDAKKGVFYGNGDRLLSIDPQNARATWEPFTAGFRNEETSLYLKYVSPMRRTRVSKDITFLYTQILNEGANITYVLDGQTDPESHSNIGAADEIPQSEVAGARNVLTRDAIHLTGIGLQEQWGVLKSAWAPIYNRQGKAVAMAGTDVDISVIREKTGVALAKVGIVAILSLFIGTLISIYIARSLTRPIAQVKDVAIQVASGKYGNRIQIQEPRELSELATSFNAMSETLDSTMNDLTEENRGLERKRRQQELRRELAGNTAAENEEAPDNLIYSWLHDKPNCADSSGYVLSGDEAWLLVWLADSSEDALQAIKLRSDIAHIAEIFLQRSEGDWNVLAPMLEDLFPDSVYCFALLDTVSSTLSALTRRPVAAALLERNVGTQQINLAQTPFLKLRAGQSVLLASTAQAATQMLAYLESAATGIALSHSVPANRTAEGLIVVLAGKVDESQQKELELAETSA